MENPIHQCSPLDPPTNEDDDHDDHDNHDVHDNQQQYFFYREVSSMQVRKLRNSCNMLDRKQWLLFHVISNNVYYFIRFAIFTSLAGKK